MKDPCPKYLEQVPPDDWEKTLVRINKMVESMALAIEKLEQLEPYLSLG